MTVYDKIIEMAGDEGITCRWKSIAMIIRDVAKKTNKPSWVTLDLLYPLTYREFAQSMYENYRSRANPFNFIQSVNNE